jgi:OOP family OmpA-OmpF porin
MKKTISIITLGTLLATGSLYAGGGIAPVVAPVPVVVDPNPFYIGVGVIWAGLSRDCFGSGSCPDVRLKDSTWGGIIRGGWEYNQYVGIEARALKATLDSDWGETTHYGIYLKPQYPIAEQLNIYGLLGYGKTTIDTSCVAINDSYDYSGFSYGIGLEYDFSSNDDTREEGEEYDRPYDGHMDQEKGWGLWIDYQNLMNNEGPPNFKSNIITFGVTYDF